MGKKASADYNLAVLYPEIASQWHPSLNGELRPNDMLPKSNEQVWWKCQTGKIDHVWQARIAERTYGKGCPFCSGRCASSDNNLALIYPDIATQWHPTLNGKLNPQNTTPMSKRKVWWQCSKGHEWQAKVCDRQKGGCRKCTGRLPTETNNFAVLSPELAKQWHPTKNKLRPDQLTVQSGRMVWWQCSQFETHVWETRVADRSRFGCPFCNESRGERRVAEVLNEYRLTYERQFKFDNCKHINALPFDFVAKAIDITARVIEYQGEQHYKAIPYFGGAKGLAERQRNDEIKREFCKSKDLRYLEIPYWMFDNIEPLVAGFVKGLLPQA